MQPPKLTFLTSPDLFDEGRRQIFSAKSGEYLGTVDNGQEINFTAKDGAEKPQPEPINPNQLKLF